jgi:hypothetical protein
LCWNFVIAQLICQGETTRLDGQLAYRGAVGFAFSKAGRAFQLFITSNSKKRLFDSSTTGRHLRVSMPLRQQNNTSDLIHIFPAASQSRRIGQETVRL